MPRRDSNTPEPWVNLKIFSNEERQEIFKKGEYIIPVNYRYNHIADCLIDLETGKQVSSILRGIRDKNKLDYIPPVLYGAGGSARPPRVLVSLPTGEITEPINPYVPGSKLHTVTTYEQKQWLLNRLVMLLFTTPVDIIPTWFDGTYGEPLIPQDSVKAMLLDAAMQNVPLVKFLNGNVHDCRTQNLSCKTQSRGNNARDVKSTQRREQRQRQLENLGIKKAMGVEDEITQDALEKLKLMRDIKARGSFMDTTNVLMDDTLPAVQPIFQRHKSGAVTVVSQEDDVNPQIIDMARILAENEELTRKVTGEKSSAEKYKEFIDGMGKQKPPEDNPVQQDAERILPLDSLIEKSDDET